MVQNPPPRIWHKWQSLSWQGFLKGASSCCTHRKWLNGLNTQGYVCLFEWFGGREHMTLGWHQYNKIDRVESCDSYSIHTPRLNRFLFVRRVQMVLHVKKHRYNTQDITSYSPYCINMHEISLTPNPLSILTHKHTSQRWWWVWRQVFGSKWLLLPCAVTTSSFCSFYMCHRSVAMTAMIYPEPPWEHRVLHTCTELPWLLYFLSTLRHS